MSLENGIGKGQMSSFVQNKVRSGAVNIKAMTDMGKTLGDVVKESEKEENKDKSLAEILLALVGKKPKTKDQNKEDKGMEI